VYLSGSQDAHKIVERRIVIIRLRVFRLRPSS
jgi:hypothetical protein